MRVWRRLSRIVLACLFLSPLSVFAAAPTDQAAAERVLGPQWKQLSRRAGMIFAGTVLSTGACSARPCSAKPPSAKQREAGLAPVGTATAQPTIAHPAIADRAISAVELRFRVDSPITDVQAGQILTIREWTGASSRQPALRSGERVLLFLYPPSRLGLTSPVGGPQGQIRLDPTGQNVAERAVSPLSKSQSSNGQYSAAAARVSAVRKLIPVSQLERAIRAARGE